MGKDTTITLGGALNLLQKAIIKEVLNQVYVHAEPVQTHRNVLKLIEQSPEPKEKQTQE